MFDRLDVTASAAALPTGTVTFVMTDIEGSTRLLQALGDRFPELIADHYRLLREAFGASGAEVRSEGDALFYAFADAPSAVRAALDGQRRLAAHQWPADAVIRVRMGIHSGEGRLLGADYVGLDAHRTARIAAAGHGGQMVLSDAIRVLEGALPPEVTLRDLGDHRLKDLERPEHLFQLVAPDLPESFRHCDRSLGARTTFPPRSTALSDAAGAGPACRSVRLHPAVDPHRARWHRQDPFGDQRQRGVSRHVSRRGPLRAPRRDHRPDLVVATIAASIEVRAGPARPVLMH